MSTKLKGIKHKWGSSWGHGTSKDVEAMKSILAAHENSDTIPISMLPLPRLPVDPNAKYIGYLPHSGFHNQRSELTNAIILGELLNRTVLVPPVWIGWPTGLAHYDDLQKTWTTAFQMNDESFQIDNWDDVTLSQPANYSTTWSEFPFPSGFYDDPAREEKAKAEADKKQQHWLNLGYQIRADGYPITNLTAAECKSYLPECRQTFQDTFLSWDALIDLERATSRVNLVDRWDVRERALENLLDAKPEDFYIFLGDGRYDFQFNDSAAPESELISSIPSNSSSHFLKSVSVPKMRELEHKVILLGSLFGTSRVVHAPDELTAFVEDSMAFRSPWLLTPADAICERLGGAGNFVGVHARVGDGVFARKARENMEFAWRNLVTKLGIPEEIVEIVWNRVRPIEIEADENSEAVVTLSLSSAAVHDEGRVLMKRTEWSEIDNSAWDDSPKKPSALNKRNFFPARAISNSESLTNLTCRSALHTEQDLLPFNVPVYLATDSHHPTEDPNLAALFAAFPCTFILSDFEQASNLNSGRIVNSIKTMSKLVNQNDKVPLGRLLLPFLEAIIAAKGAFTVGTPGSTFSAFAENGLHDAYAKELG